MRKIFGSYRVALETVAIVAVLVVIRAVLWSIGVEGRQCRRVRPGRRLDRPPLAGVRAARTGHDRPALARPAARRLHHGQPPLALLAAWVGGLCDVPRWEIERRLAAAEASDYQGPLPAGLHSVPFAAALVRAVNTFDDVTRSLRAARQAVEAADPRPSRSYWTGTAALGRSPYLSGQATRSHRGAHRQGAGRPAAARHQAVTARDRSRALRVGQHVRTHIQGIYRKLGVASRQEAIAAAREHGLLART